MYIYMCVLTISINIYDLIERAVRCEYQRSEKIDRAFVMMRLDIFNSCNILNLGVLYTYVYMYRGI